MLTASNADGLDIIKLDGGWVINLYERSTTLQNFKEYRIRHTHEGYDWRVASICLRCKAVVPEEILGFVELLRWET